MHDDFEPHGSQSIPCYSQSLSYETREEAEEVVELLRAEVAKMNADMRALLAVYIPPKPVSVPDPLEALREIAGYEIRHDEPEDVRSNALLSYWHPFTDEQLQHYSKKGKDLA